MGVGRRVCPAYWTLTASRPAKPYLTARRLSALHTGTFRSLRRVWGDMVALGLADVFAAATGGPRKLPVNPLAGIGGPS